MSECLSSTQACGILDLPVEILVKIILHFDAKERRALADSCQKFYNLVFKDAELLRDLDYSKHQNLTATDIYRYFGNEERRNHVRKVNVENIAFVHPGGGMLCDLIGQAMNLVDINILGQTFDDIEELRNFLEPLIHVKRLSVNWPICTINQVNNINFYLETRFSKLTYLSIMICYPLADVFLSILQFCTALEELRINTHPMYAERFWIPSPDPSRNKNLKIIDLRGRMSISIRHALIPILSDPNTWTEIRGFDVHNQQSYYFEKHMKVCEKLRDTVFEISESGFVSVSNRSLLEAVIKITHEVTPDELRSLYGRDSVERIPSEDVCVLNIDEAKRLLKDSGYQISYLNTPIGLDSDVHLIPSVFNNITRLISHGCEYAGPPGEWKLSQKRLKKRDTDMTIGVSYDSPFQLFIKHTPKLRELDMRAACSVTPRAGFGSETLCRMSQCKNLRVLRLRRLRAGDAKFLIVIGKNCQKLEILDLDQNWFKNSDSIERCTNDLLEMLNNGCSNLKEFGIDDDIADPNRFFISLSENLNLSKVRIISNVRENGYAAWLASIKQLIRECPKLDELIFGKIPNAIHHEFESAVQRAKVELNRPNFKFVLEHF